MGQNRRILKIIIDFDGTLTAEAEAAADAFRSDIISNVAGHVGLADARNAGERVEDVRASTRLVDSPACLVVGAYDMSANLARVLKSVGQDAPETKPTLELNLDHPLVKRLESEPDDARFSDLGMISQWIGFL